MENRVCYLAVFAFALFYIGTAIAQEPPKPEVQLRFDQAQQQEIADEPVAVSRDSAAFSRPFACKLNRKRVSEAKAYDAVTLWNVRRVSVKNRRMRLSDTTRCEKVRLLKFFIEKDRRKGARPHLLGNTAGYMWGSAVYDKARGRWESVPAFIGSYTLRSEYDSVRRANGNVPLQKVPDELWHRLSHEAVYELNGERVSGSVFQFIDGLILRRLDVYTGDEARAKGSDQPLVIGDTYPDRIPLVVFDGRISTVETWLKMCRSNAFSTTADLPMHYYYMLPLEAVQLYGKRGMYGAICIDVVR